MTRFLMSALAATVLLISASSLSIAGPIENEDGSETCNASGPSSGVADGICYNDDLKNNEDMCDGGLSTEPGGGVTCAELKRDPSKYLKARQTGGSRLILQQRRRK